MRFPSAWLYEWLKRKKKNLQRLFVTWLNKHEYLFHHKKLNVHTILLMLFWFYPHNFLHHSRTEMFLSYDFGSTFLFQISLFMYIRHMLLLLLHLVVKNSMHFLKFVLGNYILCKFVALFFYIRYDFLFKFYSPSLLLIKNNRHLIIFHWFEHFFVLRDFIIFIVL